MKTQYVRVQYVRAQRVRTQYVRLIAVAVACTFIFAGCEQLTGAGGTSAKKSTGGSVKIEDIVAATLALVATTQLSRVFVNDPNEAWDMSGEDLAKKIEAAHAKQTTCYKLTRNGATLTLDFGTGCTPPNGSISVKGVGECALTVDKSKKQLSVAMKLTNFGAGAKTATGTATMTATIGGTTADVGFVVDMTAGEAAVKGGMNVKLTASADKKSFEKAQFDTIDPTTITVSGKDIELKATGVTYESGSCYPSAGTIVVTLAGVKSTIAFDAATKTGGVAKYTPPLSKKAQDKQLTALGWTCK